MSQLRGKFFVVLPPNGEASRYSARLQEGNLVVAHPGPQNLLLYDPFLIFREKKRYAVSFASSSTVMGRSAETERFRLKSKTDPKRNRKCQALFAITKKLVVTNSL